MMFTTRSKPRQMLFGRRFWCWRVTGEYVGAGRWQCTCDCGTERIILGSDLLSGGTKSCGCGLWRENHWLALHQTDWRASARSEEAYRFEKFTSL